MLGIDYVGIATLIGATAAAVVSVIAAWSQRKLPQQSTETHAAVSMSNGGTLAGAVEQIDRATTPTGETPITSPAP